MSYIDRILTPVSAGNPVGERLLEDSLYDFVETQMMKVGSLSQHEIPWLEIEEGILKLLESKSKDLKLIGYLLQCMQYQTTATRFTESLRVLSRFMQDYWETCFPVPGARGQLPRRKYFSQIIQRSTKACSKLSLALLDPAAADALDDALQSLTESARARELPMDELDALSVQVKRCLQQEASPDTRESYSHDPASSIGAAAAPSAVIAAQIDIDSSNDRGTRQTLLKVADFLAEFEQGVEYGLRLRRFAVWFSITSEPDAGPEGETRMMPVAVERTDEYKNSLAGGADMALMRRVEQSIVHSPFWIDGHHLSARIATAMEQDSWALAIREETARFVARLPGLRTMFFKGRVPFISLETQQWLSQTVSGYTAQGGAVSDWDQKRAEAFDLADEGGLAVALTMLNEQLSGCREPRDAFYLRLISTDLKSKHNLDAMARIEYQQLHQQILKMSLDNWEPSLVQRLQTETAD